MHSKTILIPGKRFAVFVRTLQPAEKCLERDESMTLLPVFNGKKPQSRSCLSRAQSNLTQPYVESWFKKTKQIQSNLKISIITLFILGTNIYLN